jgi:hypothetical protein
MEKIANTIPPYDLLKAYRDASRAFGTRDVVLIVAEDDADGFIAKPRSVYIDEAFRRWNPSMRAMHPVTKESAHQKMKLPEDADAFWLAVEFHESGEVGYCAIGTVVATKLVS